MAQSNRCHHADAISPLLEEGASEGITQLHEFYIAAYDVVILDA